MITGRISLRLRIFLSMILLTLIASVLIAMVSIFQYRNEAVQYHKERLRMKEDAIRASINYELRKTSYEVTTDNIPYIFKDKIYEIQDIHNLSLLLFDLDGNLLKSSKAAFYETPTDTIPMRILNQLNSASDKRYVEHFREDTLRYISSYSYITDNYFKPLAILNLPYIEEDDFISKELRFFLHRLAEVYIFMMIISVIIAYYLSKNITKSLLDISEKIQKTRFDKSNKKIDTQAVGSEILPLVTAYNRMIDQLEISAQALAASERESAWREMAKQVAHEIKNPLTPMRLTVQSFERKFDKNDSQIEEKIKEFSSSLIQQIDTMSSIASAFSTYAKMPAQKDDNLNLVKITKLALDIFNEPYIHFTAEEKEIYVTLDRTQWIRVITNLVKNAVQATENTPDPQIDIHVYSAAEEAVITVSDNGKGIPPNLLEKVFEPKFTTKSSGMGLGLAMVKSIVESYNGRITLYSELHKQTVFTIVFPKFTPKK